MKPLAQSPASSSAVCDEAALARPFAPVERGDDGAIEREAGRVVAHAGDGARGRRAGIGPDEVHQPAAGPVGGGVEAGLVGLRPGLAIGGQRGVDQPRVQRRQPLRRDAEPGPQARHGVGDEDIGGADQPVQHRLRVAAASGPARGRACCGCPAPRGSRCSPCGWPGAVRQGAIGIAARRFQLDHAGAEIAEDRGRRWRRDIAGRVDHPEPGEDSGHLRRPLLVLPACCSGTGQGGNVPIRPWRPHLDLARRS